MASVDSTKPISIVRLILAPSLFTLAVTLLRLIGELNHWPSLWFNARPGGGGALMGITWLVLIFGVYFALKLYRSRERPATIGRATILALLGLATMAGGAFIFVSQIHFPGKLAIGILLIVAAAALQFAAWPALATALLAYSYAARIPVAIVMFFAIRGDWGTHYDALPPGFPDTSFWPKYVQIALVPQLVFWIAFTMVVGMLFGSIATAIFGARRLEHAST